MRRIGGEENVQQSCPATWQADDEQWFADFLLRDPGVKLAVARKEKAIAQNAHDIAAQRHFSDHIKPSLAIAGFEQAGQWLKKFSRTEVLETTATLCCLDEFGGGRRCRSYTDFFEPGGAFVQEPNRKRCAGLLDGRRGAHTSTIVAGAPEGKPASCATDTAVPSFLMTTEKATFGAGCFWGVEETFRKLSGVSSTAAGYAGGNKENPSYEDVCSDETGHAEVVQVEFDPSEITYDQILDVFWSNHNPTTLNRQGPDVGTQYRSVIFYHSPEQKAAAEKSKQKISESGRFNRLVVTQIEPAPKFWRAEEYHQRYLEKRGQSHCAI